MFKQGLAAAAVLLVVSIGQPANAQQFNNQGSLFNNNQSSLIESSFNDFERQLDQQSADMAKQRQQSQVVAAKVNQINQNANQDTENAAEQQFQNGQQQMIDGGGAYNNQGFIWGTPWGGALGTNYVGPNAGTAGFNMVP